MDIHVRQYTRADVSAMTEIWNEVVGAGNAFPQENCMTEAEAADFFAAQTFCGVAEDKTTNTVFGLYILHPNNIGRCSHIANASYAVSADVRNRHIGEKLVTHCIGTAPDFGFKILQFNAVVKTNSAARHLYEKLGFIPLGTIKDGFRKPDGCYEDICPYYISL